MRPLTLAHLCALYERYGDIPEKPKTIYRKVIYLLLENWDIQRGIKRKSKYSKFTTERKLEFLNYLAFHLSTTLSKTVFDKNDLQNIYNLICEQFSLPPNEMGDVINELETHNGLFITSGFDQFEFAHKSLQEFLTAEYLVKLPIIPKDIVSFLPNEFAIAISISTSPNIYFTAFVLTQLHKNIGDSFIETFVNRIMLEKPDFNKDPILGIGFLKLISITMHLNETVPSRLSRLFRVFSGFKSVDDSLKAIKKYYKVEKVAKMKRIVTLRYKHNLKHDLIRSFPHELIIPLEYLDKI